VLVGLIVVLLVVLVSGGAVAVWSSLQREPPLVEEVAAADSLVVELASLPRDAKQADRELRAARRAVEQLAPVGPYIVVDTQTQFVSLRTADQVMLKGVCSTGSGSVLVDSTTGRRWVFNTPQGVYKIKSKITDPWWRKPDWAFVEENEPIPRNERDRLDDNMMGEYALGIGDGYFIHGTIYERLLGVSVTHGCVRLGAKDLEDLFGRVKIGTPVYIF
jgi:hypothetical protein